MNAETLCDALEMIDDDLLEPVDRLRTGKRPSRSWIRWTSLAACIGIVTGGVWMWSRLYGPVTGETENATGAQTMASPTIEDGGAETEAFPEVGEVPEVITEGTDEGTVLEDQISMKWYDSVADCMKNADYAVICTVQEIGPAYAEKDPSIIGIPGGQGELEYIRSIRTPITLTIREILYDSTGTLGESLTVQEHRGTVDSYTLKSQFPMYEEGHEYLLYIANSPYEETSVILGQGSVELFRGPVTESEETAETVYSDFVPMMNGDIYRDYATAAEIAEAVRACGEAKTKGE